jgi:transcriptional regulator with XRE-family HTH domain
LTTKREKMTENNIGAALRALRLERGLTLDAVAQQSGYKERSYIHDIEHGRRLNLQPTIDRLNKLLTIYGKRCRIVIEEIP